MERSILGLNSLCYTCEKLNSCLLNRGGTYCVVISCLDYEKYKDEEKMAIEITNYYRRIEEEVENG